MSHIRIATRGSELALWQAYHVRDALQAARPGLEVELVIIKTRGDIILDRPLSKVGGKALFVKEIEQALLDREAQVAVHSMKDVPAELAPGLAMAATSAREDPRDALCTRDGAGLDALPQRARVGTSSLRRQCQLLAVRPDLEIIALRGNVPTRLRKLDEGEYDAVVLAAAGLVRLGHGDRISQHLPFDLSLPAVGQGVLGIETRADDADTSALVRAALDDAQVARRVAAERAFLLRLGGSCQTPVAAHAVIEGGELAIEALVGQPDGRVILRASARASLSEDPSALGVRVAEDLLGRGAKTILEACESA